MAVEKYYSKPTLACQNKHNKPRQQRTLSHLLHLHRLDFLNPKPPPEASCLFLALCTFNA